MLALKNSTILLLISANNYNILLTLRYFFIIFLIFLFPFYSTAQHLQPSFKNYTVDDGLPSSEVYVAIQDNDGYMWFGTDNGLSRFDGYEFKNYGIPDGLTDLVVFDLKLDEGGKLWIMTMTGKVFIYDGKIKPYRYNHIIQEYADDFIYAKNMYVEDGVLTICLELFGILKIDSLGESEITQSTSNNIQELMVFSNGGNIMSFLSSKEYSTEYEKFKASLLHSRLSPPITIKSGSNTSTFQLTTNQGHGYSIVNLNHNRILLIFENRRALFHNGKITWQDNSNQSYNHSLSVTGNILWLALNGKQGIQIYDRIEDIELNEYQSILEGTSVSKLYKDRSGGIWATSLDSGIYYSSSFTQNSILSGNGLSNSYISGISMSSENLYIVTRDKTVHQYNFKDSSLEHFHRKSDIQSKYALIGQDIYYSSKQKILFGGLGAIVWSQGKAITIVNIDQRLKKIHTLKIIGSNEFENKILISSSRVASLIDIKENRLLESTNHTKTWTTCANYDHLGNRWVGREDGIWLWTNDTLIRPDYIPEILQNRVDAIEFDANNNLVVGTKGNGIILWDRKESVIQIGEKDGLTSNIIENIFIDSLQQIWAGTLNGLNKVTVGNKIKVKQFTKKHGLPGNEIVKIRRRGDDIWVATTTGLGKIKDLKENTKTIKPILNRFIVNGSNTSILESNRFPSTDNNISIEYVALDFKALGDITYRYRLHATQDWQEIKNTSINLPDLRSNYYEFEIQAQNEDGYWSESLLIPFQILQPIYARTWFIILAALISVGALGSYLRRRQLREQEIQQNTINQLKQEHATKSQIVELERSALQAQMNPHFIFNILNSIQSAINGNEKEMASQTLAKFAKLIRATLKNAKTSAISLEEEINYIESYLYLEQIRFKKEAFQYKVTCSPEIDQYDTLIPPMLVQPFVENAIKHGVKDNSNAMVSVNYTKDRDTLIVKVRDNGSGIDKLQQKQDHRSYGMSITQRRLELLNNEDDIMETFRIEQLRDHLGEISGTEIIIRINISLPATHKL